MKSIKTFLLLVCFLSLSLMTYAQNARNMVIEYTTSTQCGGCPCLDSVLQQVVLVKHPETIVLACHTAWSHFGTYHGQGISDSLNSGGGDPSACIDRTVYNVEGFSAFVDSVDARYNSAPLSPVKIEVAAKSYNASTRMLTVEIVSESLSDTLNGLYRLNFVIVEGKIKFQQSAHPPCTGGADYIHYDVVRNMVNDMYGDTLINGAWARNQSIHKTYSTLIDQEWVDQNCDFIVYVYKQNPGPLGKVYNYHIQQGIRQPVTGPLSMNDTKAEVSSVMKIFPNPASFGTHIHLNIQKETHADLRIFSLDGKEVSNLINSVLQKGIYNMDVTLENIPKGIYQCILKTDDGIDVEKLVII